MSREVTLYGDDGSWETVRVRHQLETLGVSYRYVPVRDASSRERARGERTTPTVQVSDGSRTRTLGAPNETALDVMLRRLGVLGRG